MKKNFIKGFFGSYSIIQVLLLAAMLVCVPLFAFELDVMVGSNNWVFDAGIIKAISYLVFGGIALVWLTTLKTEKVGFIDLAGISSILATVGAIIIACTHYNKLSAASYIYIAILVVLIVELIVKIALCKTSSEVSGSKQYFSTLFTKANPVILALIGGIVGLLFVSLMNYGSDFYKNVVDDNLWTLMYGVVILFLIIPLLASHSKVSILDVVAVIAFVAFLVVVFYGSNKAGFPYKKFPIVLALTSVSIYLRAITYSGGEPNKSKIKINNYYGAVYSKYEITLPIIIALFTTFAIVLPTLYPNFLNNVVYTLFNKTVNFYDYHEIFAYIGFGIIVLLLLLTLIFRNIKSKDLVFSDYLLLIISLILVFSAPYFIKVLANPSYHIDLLGSDVASILALVALAVLAIACIAVSIVRYIYYQVGATEEALAADSENVSATDEVEEDEDEVVEQPTEEEAVPAEEEPQIVEEEQPEDDLVDTTEEVVEEQPAEEEVVEEEVAPAEEEPEEVVEDGEAVEQVIYVDEDGNPVELDENTMIITDEEVVEEEPQEVVEETTEEVVEEEPQEVVEESSQPQDEALNSDANPEDGEEEEDEAEEEEAEDEEDEPEEGEDNESDANAIEVHESKEKGIVMPEINVVDEDGKPKKIKRKFNTRMMFAPYEAKEYYNEVKNYLMMYRAKGRYSARCESFRYKGLIAKVSLAGKSLRVCLAIDPQSLEGTKYYYKDVSDKKQYQEVPTMVKVRSHRGLKYFKELVDMMMAAREVKPKRNYHEVNLMPTLIPNGEAILATLGMSTDYLYDSMNVKSIPQEMPDVLEDYLPVIQAEPLNEEEVEANVYLDTLCNHFNEGDEVTIDTLKSLHIVTRGNVLRIKARGTLDRKLIIYAEYFDADALKMLMCTNCTAIKIIR